MNFESGKALVEAVRAGAVRKAITVAGFVKPNEKDPNSLLFAPGRDCTHWVQVPADVIAAAQALGRLPCGDHSHDAVMLTLNEPDPKNVHAAMFAALLRQHVAGTGAVGRAFPTTQTSSPCDVLEGILRYLRGQWIKAGRPSTGPIHDDYVNTLDNWLDCLHNQP